VLKLFADHKSTAQRRYKNYLAKGIAMGKRPDLIGGGLVRSSGGWSAIKAFRKAKVHLKSDERILGDSDFVDEVLNAADESLDRRYALKVQGWDLDRLAVRAAGIYGLEPEQIYMRGKQTIRVKARSLFCYWATSELGVTMTELAGILKVSQPSVSICAKRGAEIVRAEGYNVLGD
jgi:putative transposase